MKGTLIFKGNIQGPDQAEIKLKIKFNKGFRILLCVIDIYSKYVCKHVSFKS